MNELVHSSVEQFPFPTQQRKKKDNVQKEETLRKEIKVLQSKLAQLEDEHESFFLTVVELEKENQYLEDTVQDLVGEKRRLEKEIEWFFWMGIATAGVMLFTPDIADLIKSIIAI